MDLQVYFILNPALSRVRDLTTAGGEMRLGGVGFDLFCCLDGGSGRWVPRAGFAAAQDDIGSLDYTEH